MSNLWDVYLPGVDPWSWKGVHDLEEVATGVKFTTADGSKVTIRRGDNALVLHAYEVPN